MTIDQAYKLQQMKMRGATIFVRCGTQESFGEFYQHVTDVEINMAQGRATGSLENSETHLDLLKCDPALFFVLVNYKCNRTHAKDQLCGDPECWQKETDLAAEIERLKAVIDWQNVPNRIEPFRGGYEFYINEEWTCIRDAAMDEDPGFHASLLKVRYDPDDERVRIRRVLDDDAILEDAKTATAERDELRGVRDVLLEACESMFEIVKNLPPKEFGPDKVTDWVGANFIAAAIAKAKGE